jgi:hypothetical protein
MKFHKHIIHCEYCGKEDIGDNKFCLDDNNDFTSVYIPCKVAIIDKYYSQDSSYESPVSGWMEQPEGYF